MTSQDMSRLKTNLGGSEVRDTETIRRVTFHVIIHLFKPCIAHGDSQGPGCYIEDHLHMPFGNFGLPSMYLLSSLITGEQLEVLNYVKKLVSVSQFVNYSSRRFVILYHNKLFKFCMFKQQHSSISIN